MPARFRAAVVLCALAWPGSAAAQSPLTSAIALYEKAAFEDALHAIDTAAGLAADDEVVALQYRVLCLLALDRPAEAQEGANALITRHPTFRLDPDAAPRLEAAVRLARRQVLPEVIREAYDAARTDWDAHRVEDAARGFARVAELGEVLKTAGAVDRPVADLLVVSDGFARLAAAEIATAAARAAAEREAARLAAEAAEAAAAEAAAPPPEPAPAPGAPRVAEVFDDAAADVTPPVPLGMPLTWRRGTPRPPAGTRLGEIAVIVDERGHVLSAQMVTSVSAFYDAIVVESARAWRYRPATRAGQPVLYRRVMVIRAE